MILWSVSVFSCSDWLLLLSESEQMEESEELLSEDSYSASCSARLIRTIGPASLIVTTPL